MNFLLDPNVAYVILVIGLLIAILAMFSPGTGVLELAAVFALVFDGYSISNMPINWWALGLLALGLIFFLLAFRDKSRRMVYLVISWLALLIGSVFLFRGKSDFQPAVNPILATIVSILTTGFLYIVVQDSLKAMRLRPVNRTLPERGTVGEARTVIHDEGSVYLNGEMWSARSNQNIPAKARVRVVHREGFILEVEEVKEQAQPTALSTTPSGEHSAQ
ncbi:MAG TPA: NfeD family protein [Anaerolineaceae bacterium]|nr:NfeD family protein [Anaerolineaceae bacterium]